MGLEKSLHNIYPWKLQCTTSAWIPEEIPEVGQVGPEHEEEEAAEGAENDDELHDEGGQADEAELDSRRDLAERFLETEISSS